MKKIIKKRALAVLMVLCVVFSLNVVIAFAAEPDTVQDSIIIGEYDGLLSDCMDSDSATSRTIANVRINSYATYDEDDGIQVHIKLYVPWYEFPKPEFTSMSGTVTVNLNSKASNTRFAEIAAGDDTIETDVDTGRTGKSGNKGTVSVSGVATADNALTGGGAFAISYAVTIP